MCHSRLEWVSQSSIAAPAAVCVSVSVVQAMNVTMTPCTKEHAPARATALPPTPGSSGTVGKNLNGLNITVLSSMLSSI